MNTDAAQVMDWLQSQPCPRRAATIARHTGIPRDRVNGALTLLAAIDKVTIDQYGLAEATKDAYSGTERELLDEIHRWLVDALSRNQIVHQIDRNRAIAFVSDIADVKKR